MFLSICCYMNMCCMFSSESHNGDEHSQFRQSKSFRTFQRNISTKHNKSVISSLLVVLRCVFVFESKSYRFGRTWGWENEDRAFIFSWTITLNEYFLNEYHNFWTHIHAHILTNWSQKEPSTVNILPNMPDILFVFDLWCKIVRNSDFFFSILSMCVPVVQW